MVQNSNQDNKALLSQIRKNAGMSIFLGITMLVMWLDYYADICRENNSQVRLGAAARIDIEVRVGEKATLGFFVRPEVFTDEVYIKGTRIIHYVTLTSGLSLHFDLGSAGGAS